LTLEIPLEKLENILNACVTEIGTLLLSKIVLKVEL
jgi:hypothetical protein